MNEHIIRKLKQYADILENHFHDMMDIEFTVENGEIYILSARAGRRTVLANLKIVVSLFCEGKMDVEDVIKKIPYQQIGEFLDNEIFVGANELKLLGQGMPACEGGIAAKVCFTAFEAERFISKKEKFIICQEELLPEIIEIICSKYCCAVITARGGMTSHAAVVCRGLGIPCVSGFGNLDEMKKQIQIFGDEITVDGNSGKIYSGIGKFEKSNSSLMEIKILYELLLVVIRNNIITGVTAPLVWRLWDTIVLNKRYGKDNTKQLVLKKEISYISFVKPKKHEIESIYSKLQYVENGNIIIEDLTSFLFDEISAKV